MKKKVQLFLAIFMALMAIPASVLADSPTPLGGLTLMEYCISEGYTGVTLTKPQIGPNAAFNNWRCTTSGGRLHPFSMEQACRWQYGVNQVQTHPTDPDDAFTWVCYSTQHQAGVILSHALAATDPIRIPAKAGWVNTGMIVAEGETLRLDTRGKAITGPLNIYPGARSGPDGQVWNLGCGEYEAAPPPCAMDFAPYGALVGKIGDSGEPFLISGAPSFEAPAAGTLYLAVNDNLAYYSDNQAGFTALFR